MIIGSGASEQVKRTGLEIKTLDMDFDITRARTFEENSALFSVFNLSRESKDKFVKKGSALIFSAGYEDEGIGTIFSGAISDIKEEMDGGDVKTTIQAVTASGENDLDTVYVELGYSKGAFVSDIINQISVAMGLAVYGLGQARVKLNNGFFFSGTARQALKRCQWFLLANNVEIMIDNGEIILWNIQGSSRYSVGVVGYNSGLISARAIVSDKPGEEDKKRIEVKSLLVPKYRPDSLVKIEGDSVTGIFVIDKIQFVGSTYGEDFDCVMECVE